MFKKVEGKQIMRTCLYSGRCTDGTGIIILHPSQSSCRVKGMPAIFHVSGCASQLGLALVFRTTSHFLGRAGYTISGMGL
jgi:hypothetical protein